MGYLRYERRLMQTAADSAAFAAAMDINLGNASQAHTDATTVLGTYGFQNGVNNVAVTYSNPAGNMGAAEIEVQQTLPTFFMKIFGITSVNAPPISATGQAALVPSSGCVYALGAAGLTSTAGIDSPNCGIVDNGTLSGGGTLTASSVGVYGDASGYSGGGTTIEATVQKAADPLAYLTPPTPGTCSATAMPIAVSGPLSAGTYCSGITISTGVNVTFGSGLYILTGNTGLQIQGTATATGTGVTFYNHSTYLNSTNTGAITFGTGSITLSAPTSALDGLPAGILFYQDTPPAADLSEGGTTGAVTLSGTLYFPNAPLTVAGSLTPSANSPIVASTITVSGSTRLYVDSTSQSITLPGGTPLISVSLVE
jgi:hypothetical protein